MSRSMSYPGDPYCAARKSDLTLVAAVLLETERCLRRRRDSGEIAHVKSSLAPVLHTLNTHVLEFEEFVQ